MQGLPMDKWSQLSMLGTRYGTSGWPTENLPECLRTWTAVTFKELYASQQQSVTIGDAIHGGQEERAGRRAIAVIQLEGIMAL